MVTLESGRIPGTNYSLKTPIPIEVLDWRRAYAGVYMKATLTTGAGQEIIELNYAPNIADDLGDAKAAMGQAIVGRLIGLQSAKRRNAEQERILASLSEILERAA